MRSGEDAFIHVRDGSGTSAVKAGMTCFAIVFAIGFLLGMFAAMPLLISRR